MTRLPTFTSLFLSRTRVYFAYKRAKATDIRTPSIAKNKSMRGLLFTCRAMIDTANVNRNTKKAVFPLSRKRTKRKGEHGIDKANRLSYSWAKKGIPEYYQEGNEHMEKGEFSNLLFHFIRFTCSSSANHTPSQPAFSAFRSKDFNCFLFLISSLIMVLGH